MNRYTSSFLVVCTIAGIAGARGTGPIHTSPSAKSAPASTGITCFSDANADFELGVGALDPKTARVYDKRMRDWGAAL